MKNTKREILCTFLILILSILSSALSVYIGQFWSDTISCILFILAVMLLPTAPAVTIVVIVPFILKFTGILSLPVAISAVIAISNILFITVYTVAFQIFASRSPWQRFFTWGVSILVSSLLRFEMQFLVIGKFLLGFLNINTPINYTFGANQFWSAVLSGVLVTLFIYPLKDKLRR